MKQTVKAYVYAWVSDNGTLGDVQISNYQMFGENWVPVYKNEEGKARQIEVEVEVPDAFLQGGWRGAAIENLEREERNARAELQRKLADIWELREKILALPAPVAETPALDDDLSF